MSGKHPGPPLDLTIVLEAVLDHLRPAILLADREARILWRNRTAGALMDRRCGLLLDAAGRLTARDADQDTLQLRRLIGRCCACETDFGWLGVHRVSGDRAHRHTLLVAMPLGENLRHDAGRLAMLVVSDPDEPPVSAATLRVLFDLTTRQAQVASLLTRGLSPREVAAQLGIGHESVRSHIHQLREKTDTHRLSDLTRLLLISGFALSIPPPAQNKPRV
jgi:DNA-binding CsgD family transcriptional regulator